MQAIDQSHAFGRDCGADARYAGAHGRGHFAFDAGAEKEWRDPDPTAVKDGSEIRRIAENFYSGPLTERDHLRRHSRTNNLEQGLGQRLVNQRPDVFCKPGHAMDIG